MKKITILFLSLFLMAGMINAQIRKLPAEVTTTFSTSYPTATNVTWKDNLTNFEAQFDQSGDHSVAKFNTKGVWLETTRDLRFDNLNVSIKDGFNKSKYNDWEKKEIKELAVKGKETLYRIHVSKQETVINKYLYFNVKGQLVRDALTL
ncbi:MAG: hypothetical protein JWQ30_1222 [Sediminibacterium sp.]|nr:hypothetical protein [Sediminibacterium sp.]